MWWRGVNDRKREVEEKAKQLEQVASLSALIAGFALVAMVEVNIPGKVAVIRTHLMFWVYLSWDTASGVETYIVWKLFSPAF